MTDEPATPENKASDPLPSNVDMAGAVALMANLPGRDDPPPPVDPSAAKAKAPEAAIDPEQAGGDPEPQPEADETDPALAVDPEAGDPEPEPEPESEAAPVDAPEFWTAEDKAAWATVPAEVRPILQKYEDQRAAYVKTKEHEAAQVRQEAKAEVAKLNETVAGAAAWWQENGPRLGAMFTDKWTRALKEAGVSTWAELAEQNPALWTKLSQERHDEATLLMEAQRRGQADIEAAQKQAATEAADRLQAAKRTAHETMVKKYPQAFANADDIYNKKLGPFLVEMGIPVDRVNAISEAPILEIAYMAYLQREAQKTKQQASAVLAGKPPAGATATKTSAPATPTRVPPGPARPAANRQTDAQRQARERFRKDRSVANAAELIRLNGL